MERTNGERKGGGDDDGRCLCPFVAFPLSLALLCFIWLLHTHTNPAAIRMSVYVLPTPLAAPVATFCLLLTLLLQTTDYCCCYYHCPGAAALPHSTHPFPTQRETVPSPIIPPRKTRAHTSHPTHHPIHHHPPFGLYHPVANSSSAVRLRPRTISPTRKESAPVPPPPFFFCCASRQARTRSRQ
jgi:hypothetical protein